MLRDWRPPRALGAAPLRAGHRGRVMAIGGFNGIRPAWAAPWPCSRTRSQAQIHYYVAMAPSFGGGRGPRPTAWVAATSQFRLWAAKRLRPHQAVVPSESATRCSQRGSPASCPVSRCPHARDGVFPRMSRAAGTSAGPARRSRGRRRGVRHGYRYRDYSPPLATSMSSCWCSVSPSRP